MHILVPVTAEGYDVPQSPEVCRMPLCYPLRCSLFAHIIFFPSYPLSSFCFLLTLFSYPLSCLSFFPSSSLPILLSSPLLPTILTTLSTFILFRPMFFFLYLYIFPFSSLTISHSKLPFSSVWIFFFFFTPSNLCIFFSLLVLFGPDLFPSSLLSLLIIFYLSVFLHPFFSPASILLTLFSHSLPTQYTCIYIFFFFSIDNRFLFSFLFSPRPLSFSSTSRIIFHLPHLFFLRLFPHILLSHLLPTPYTLSFSPLTLYLICQF